MNGCVDECVDDVCGRVCLLQGIEMSSFAHIQIEVRQGLGVFESHMYSSLYEWIGGAII